MRTQSKGLHIYPSDLGNHRSQSLKTQWLLKSRVLKTIGSYCIYLESEFPDMSCFSHVLCAFFYMFWNNDLGNYHCVQKTSLKIDPSPPVHLDVLNPCWKPRITMYQQTLHLPDSVSSPWACTLSCHLSKGKTCELQSVGDHQPRLKENRRCQAMWGMPSTRSSVPLHFSFSLSAESLVWACLTLVNLHF